MREAINAANATVGRDVISFNFAAPTTILPNSELPEITDSVTIDGQLHNAGHCPTETESADLFVTLSGFNAGESAIGLNFDSDDNIIRGLNIVFFDSWGLYVEYGTENNVITCNHIGLPNADVDGWGNGAGLYFGGIRGQIGGQTASERNVIAGNIGAGIYLSHPVGDNVIEGNYIGATRDGLGAFGNSDGIYLWYRAGNNTIGGTNATSRNVIAGNRAYGINIEGDAMVVEGNYIGVGADGNTPVPNQRSGINIDDGEGNVIGTVNSPNLIAHNSHNGIVVRGSSSDRNSFRYNAIYDNNLLGIDLKAAPEDGGDVTLNDNLDADVGPNGL